MTFQNNLTSIFDIRLTHVLVLLMSIVERIRHSKLDQAALSHSRKYGLSCYIYYQAPWYCLGHM